MGKHEKLNLKLLRIWGQVFRFYFIAAIGCLVFIWSDVETVIDTSFSDLSIRLVAKGFLGILIPFSCIYWFNNFPEHDPELGDPYHEWGRYGLKAIIYGTIGYVLINAFFYD